MASVLFSLIVPSIVCFAIVSEVLVFVEGFPPRQGPSVIYTRYVRRRPIPNSNNYFKEVIEVFNTKRRPPPYAFLHDEDLTRFVRCDFDPSLPDCDGADGGGNDDSSMIQTTSTKPYPTTSTRGTFIDGNVQPETTTSGTMFSFWKSPTTKVPITTTTTATTTSPTEMVSSISTSTTSTERSSFWWSPKTKVTSTTSTTEQNIHVMETDVASLPQTPSTSLVTTSTTMTPQLPDEYDEDKSAPEDDKTYDDDTGNGNDSKEAGDPDPIEYYDTDEAETTGHTVTDIDTGFTDTEAQSEATSPKPTKKSFFDWL